MRYCEHEPIVGYSVFIITFIIVIILLWGWMYYQLILRRKSLKAAVYRKPFLCFSLSMVSLSSAFYFIFRCVSHNGRVGYPTALEHEIRSTDFGCGGILWFVSMLLLIISVKTLVKAKSTKRVKNDMESDCNV